jgi:dUTP pyrophosphatase
MEIFVRKLVPEATMPRRAHPDDAGFDLAALKSCFVMPNARTLVKTGLTVRLPPGFAGFICPRSGLALEQGITVANAPGIIDASYTGEILVTLVNHGSTYFFVHPGSRIAQLVIQQIPPVELVLADNAERTLTENNPQTRGERGFGSTGLRG